MLFVIFFKYVIYESLKYFFFLENCMNSKPYETKKNTELKIWPMCFKYIFCPESHCRLNIVYRKLFIELQFKSSTLKIVWLC